MGIAEKPAQPEAEKAPGVRRPFYEPGWYRDLSNDDYHGSFGVGSTTLKTLVERTPAHMLYDMTHPKESTAAMALGTAVHALVLEPETFSDQVAVLPEGLNLRTKDGRATRDAFEQASAGKTIITAAQLEVAQAMAESVHSHPIAGVLLQNIIPESSVYWWYRTMDNDEIDAGEKYKEMLKVRPDALSVAHPVIVDLKTTRDASYSGFIKAIQNLHYHLSAAMYLEGVNQCRELLEHTRHFAYTKFVFVCVENEPPYPTAVYELAPEYIELGKVLYRRAMRTLRDARQNDWPAYPDDIRVIEPPSWASRGFIV